jgi:signal transduction histidine kinase
MARPPSTEGTTRPDTAGGAEGLTPPTGHVWVLGTVVMAALLAAAVLPIGVLVRERPVRREIEQVIDPARQHVAAIRSAIERSVASHAAYMLSGNPVLLARADDWRARQERETALLAAMSDHLDPTVRTALAHFQGRQRRFEEMGRTLDADAARAAPDRLRSLPDVDGETEGLLAACDDVGEALDASAEARRDRLERFGQEIWLAVGIVCALGIVAAGAVGRLTGRERRAHAAAERARLAAEAATRMRDEIVAIVSHDLRSPLATVDGAAKYLLASAAATGYRAEDRRLLEMITRAAETMNRMIQDLLDIARIESGGLVVERTEVPVAPLVEEAAAMLRPEAEKGGQQLVCTTGPDLPAICGDRHRLLQILSNLLGNAVKFTPPGGTITLAAERTGEDVEFRVADTGAGIAPENLPRLFDRFWQARRGDRRGLGLGLPIVKALVEAHGSQVEVESALGAGTTFRFRIRAAPALPATA